MVDPFTKPMAIPITSNFIYYYPHLITLISIPSIPSIPSISSWFPFPQLHHPNKFLVLFPAHPCRHHQKSTWRAGHSTGLKPVRKERCGSSAEKELWLKL